MVCFTHLKVILSIDVRLGQFILYLQGGISNLHHTEFTSFPFSRLLVDMNSHLVNVTWMGRPYSRSNMHVWQTFFNFAHVWHTWYKVVKKQAKINPIRNYVVEWTSVTNK